MCIHNDEDYECLDCCYFWGKEDALENLPCEPEYKNFDQCNSYRDGYQDGLLELERLNES